MDSLMESSAQSIVLLLYIICCDLIIGDVFAGLQRSFWAFPSVKPSTCGL